MTFCSVYRALVWDHSIFEEGKNSYSDLCVFTNPFLVLRFMYAGYCGVLGHCFECTEERV